MCAKSVAVTQENLIPRMSRLEHEDRHDIESVVGQRDRPRRVHRRRPQPGMSWSSRRSSLGTATAANHLDQVMRIRLMDRDAARVLWTMTTSRPDPRSALSRWISSLADTDQAQTRHEREQA
jgi:hypothetical protein